MINLHLCDSQALIDALRTAQAGKVRILTLFHTQHAHFLR